MYPTERSLVKEFAGRPFALVGVNSDQSPERLKPVLKAEQITWPSFYEGKEERISRSWNVRSWPSTRLIDADGILRDRNGAKLHDAIEKLVKEAETRHADSL